MQNRIIFFVSWILVLCVSASSLIYVFYDIAQYKSKGSAHECIKERIGLSVIKIPRTQFKDGDEIWVNGELYDVISFTTDNDSVCVSVYHDDGEEGLVKTIAASFETDEINSSDHLTHVCRHRANAPNSDRVLLRQSQLPYKDEKVASPFSQYIQYPPGRHGAAITHPPERCDVFSV